ncbi:MAG: type IV toxin-antitoxin system AbiEi family antitoxin domain-containing protein [Deltaproteobacteria bacterium]|nr:type IV toxin-antitoxin system AbiEi family antitoxin domain-containing protein [Deltaproteobacteria bacterium]
MPLAREKVLDLLKKNKGFLPSKLAREAGISFSALKRLERNELIKRATRGLYIGSDVWPDEFYIAQFRYPNAIFSHETALYLHGLCDRYPMRLMMTALSGDRSNIFKDPKIRVFRSGANLFNERAETIETELGNSVTVYSMERTLCECLFYRDILDLDHVISALKWYILNPDRDFDKLLKCAELFNMRREVHFLMAAML